MASATLRTLLQPPSQDQSTQRAVDLLNSRFTSLEQLDELEDVVLEAQTRCDGLQQKVCHAVLEA